MKELKRLIKKWRRERAGADSPMMRALFDLFIQDALGAVKAAKKG